MVATVVVEEEARAAESVAAVEAALEVAVARSISFVIRSLHCRIKRIQM